MLRIFLKHGIHVGFSHFDGPEGSFFGKRWNRWLKLRITCSHSTLRMLCMVPRDEYHVIL